MKKQVNAEEELGVRKMMRVVVVVVVVVADCRPMGKGGILRPYTK